MSVIIEKTSPMSSHIKPAAMRSLLVCSALAGAVILAPVEANANPPTIEFSEAAESSSFTYEDLRTIEVSLDQLPIGNLNGKQILSYSPYEMLQSVRPSELIELDEASVALRLIISEVGADRLVNSQYGLEEALAILHTVGNRLIPAVFDPDNDNITPYEGCGSQGSFGACANPDQYLGMSTRRALKPLRQYNRDTILEAADIAFLAWSLYSSGDIPDFTGGATVYVHRCGGAAYGQTTYHCDGTDDRGISDTPGANPHTGPMILSAPLSIANGGGEYLNNHGFYNIQRSYLIDYQRTTSDPLWLSLIEAENNFVSSNDTPDEEVNDRALSLWLSPLAPPH